MESRVTFPVETIVLEGRLEKTEGTKAVIITHPHPLMGGDMGNAVVEKIRQAYMSKGYATLRFNFRGAGQSGGVHDDGKGEVNDVLGARSFLTDRGYTDIELAGYSFGAYVNLAAAFKHAVFSKVVLVSPPVDFMDFGHIGEASSLCLVVSGEHDAYASPSHIKKLLKIWNKNAIFKEIPGADHFYSGTLGALGQCLSEQL